MNTALVLIATGKVYWQFIEPFLASADQYFVPHDTFLFTDAPRNFGVNQIKINNLGYPRATLKRYHIFLSQKEWLSYYDYIFYCDIDMLFVNRVGSEVFSHGLTATRHAGFLDDDYGAYLEDNPRSKAYTDKLVHYYAGGFNGGTSGSFLHMAETISHNVDLDSSNGIVAKWHDESHLNRYLLEHPPAKILSHAYCYPEGSDATRKHYRERWKVEWGEDVLPRIIALEKSHRCVLP